MEVTHFAAHLLEKLSGILRLNGLRIRRRTAAVLYTYGKLKLLKLAQRAFNLHRSRVNIHGWMVNYFTLRDLITVYEEIFIEQIYFFGSRTVTPYIIDCGANVGMAVLYFKDLYPNSRIAAFEPHKATYEKLLENISTNGLGNIMACQCALSDRSGDAPLHTNSNRPGYIGMSLSDKAGTYDSSEQVQCALLSEFVREHVDMLKMDIEGSELRVMQDLEEHKKLGLFDNTIIEYHHHIDGSDSLSKLLALLERNSFGYQITATHRAYLTDLRKASQIIVIAYRKHAEELPLGK